MAEIKNIMKCPQGCDSTFLTTAHVMQEWEVDMDGGFVGVSDESLETTHGPDRGNIWSCKECGAEAEEVKVEVSTALVIPAGTLGERLSMRKVLGLGVSVDDLFVATSYLSAIDDGTTFDFVNFDHAVTKIMDAAASARPADVDVKACYYIMDCESEMNYTYKASVGKSREVSTGDLVLFLPDGTRISNCEELATKLYGAIFRDDISCEELFTTVLYEE